MLQPHPHFVRAVQLIQAGRVPEGALILNQLGAAGDAKALATLAEMKWTGMLAQDIPGARTLFERAGAAGDPLSAHRATNLMAAGIGGPRDWPRAVERLRAEAARDAGRARALALLDAMALDANGDPVTLPAAEPLSTSPGVTRFPAAFTAAECDYVRNLNASGFAPAMVFDAQRRPVRDPIRTSDEATLSWIMEDPAIHALNRRLAAISGTTPEQGEAAQVLRYQPGQQYRSHYDYQPGAKNQRVQTALVYLNDDYQGGETAFLKTGLKVKGAKGDAIVFVNVDADGRRDDMAEHAGMPVTRGTKYLLSRWIRAERWAP